jgi:alpha-mannosidase
VIPLDRYTAPSRLEAYRRWDTQAFTVRRTAALRFPGYDGDFPQRHGERILRVSFHADGTFDLFDKRTLRTTQPALLRGLREAGDGFSRVPPLMDRVILSTSGGARISLVENTSLRVTYQVDMELELPESLTADRQGRSGTLVPCSISSRITLLRGAPRVDIHTTVVNRAKDHRLRVVFPSMISGDTSYAETPFDVVNRNIATPDPNDFPGEKPYREHPQLSFAGITDGEVGLMVANQGLYEYEVIDNTEHSIAVTLLRCLDRIIGGPIYVSEDLLIPEAQCLGEYSFDYSVIPHAGSWRNAYREAYGFRFPMKAVVRRDLEDQQLPEFDPVRLSKVLPVSQAFVEVDSADLVVTAVKKHETRKSLVVRVLNISEKSVSGAVRVNAPGFAAGDIYRISLEERRQEKLAMGNGGWIPLDIVGRGIVTVEFERKE